MREKYTYWTPERRRSIHEFNNFHWNAGFWKLIRSGVFYVDKTSFYPKKWWENQDDVTLVTRPRRFWKDVNSEYGGLFFLQSACRFRKAV